jgi:hypothetical protein
VGTPRPSGGDIEVNWWGYQGQAVGYRGQLVGELQGQRGGALRSRSKKVVGGACPLQLPLLRCDQETPLLFNCFIANRLSHC